MEPPGTAPGSDPFIPCAFMPIVPPKEDRLNIGGPRAVAKGGQTEICADCGGLVDPKETLKCVRGMFLNRFVTGLEQDRVRARAT